jgi:hypothetical protein
VRGRLEHAPGDEEDHFFRAALRVPDRLTACRLRVAAAFFAERDRAAAGR